MSYEEKSAEEVHPFTGRNLHWRKKNQFVTDFVSATVFFYSILLVRLVALETFLTTGLATFSFNMTRIVYILSSILNRNPHSCFFVSYLRLHNTVCYHLILVRERQRKLRRYLALGELGKLRVASPESRSSTFALSANSTSITMKVRLRLEQRYTLISEYT